MTRQSSPTTLDVNRYRKRKTATAKPEVVIPRLSYRTESIQFSKPFWIFTQHESSRATPITWVLPLEPRVCVLQIVRYEQSSNTADTCLPVNNSAPKPTEVFRIFTGRLTGSEIVAISLTAYCVG
jgi:hypothetical protein